MKTSRHWEITLLKSFLLGTAHRVCRCICLTEGVSLPTNISIRVSLPVSSSRVHHPPVMQMPSAIHHLPRARASRLRRAELHRLQDESPVWPRLMESFKLHTPMLGQTKPTVGLCCNEYCGRVMQTTPNSWRCCISTGQAGQPRGCRSLKIFAPEATEHRAGSKHGSIWPDRHVPMTSAVIPCYGWMCSQASLRYGPGGSRVGECSTALAARSPHYETFGPYLLLKNFWFQLPAEEASASSILLCLSMTDQSCVIHTRSRHSGRGMSSRYILQRLE